MIPEDDGGGPMDRGHERLAKFRLVQAEQRYRSALRWLADFESATWPDVRVFLSSYCPPGAAFETFLIRIRKWETDRLRPIDVKENGRALDDELRLAMAEFRRGFDPLSLVGSIISPLDDDDSISWRILGDAPFLDPFTGSGGFVTITGPPRTGKTGIACHFIDRWLRADPRALAFTNIILANPEKNPDEPRIIETPGVQTLQREVIRAVLDRRRWLWIFDDAGLEWLKQRPQTGSAIALERFARIVPKHSGSLVYIDQRERGIPTTISEFTEWRVRAVRPTVAYVRLPGLTAKVIRDIPKPSIRYVSEARSAFMIDGDVEDLIRAIPRPELA